MTLDHAAIKQDIERKKRQIRERHRPEPQEVARFFDEGGFSGRSPFEGIELAKEYSLLLEETLKALTADYQSQLAFLGHGTFGRQEMSLLSDVDLIILNGGLPDEEYWARADRLKRSLIEVGLEPCHTTNLWSTTEQWTRQGRLDIIDIDKTDCSRFLFGDRKLFDDFRQRLKAINISPEELYLNFLINSWYNYWFHRWQWIGQQEPQFKYMQGGRWDVVFIVKCLRHMSPEQNRQYRAGDTQNCSLLIKNDNLDYAINFLYWLRDANHAYSLEHNMEDCERFTENAQEEIASNLGIRRETLVGALEKYRRKVLLQAEQMELRVDERFYQQHRTREWWEKQWLPLKKEIYGSKNKRRDVDQEVIARYKGNDDTIFRLVYIWFSSDSIELENYGRQVIQRGISPGDWAYLVGLVSNSSTPIGICKDLLPLVGSAYELREIRRGIEWRLSPTAQ